jgi:hypothetical protein
MTWPVPATLVARPERCARACPKASNRGGDEIRAVLVAGVMFVILALPGAILNRFLI